MFKTTTVNYLISLGPNNSEEPTLFLITSIIVHHINFQPTPHLQLIISVGHNNCLSTKSMWVTTLNYATFVL